MALVPHGADPHRKAELARRERDIKEGRHTQWAELREGDVTPFDEAKAFRYGPAPMAQLGGEEGKAERLICELLGTTKNPRTVRYARPVVDELLKAAKGDEAKARAALASPETAERLNFFRGLLQL